MLLRRVVALGAAASMLAAPKLWITSGRLYPAAPLFGWMPAPPFPVDYILFGLALAALAGMAISARVWFPAAFLAATGVLVVLDQSRLQPWLIQYGVLAGALVAGPLAVAPTGRLLLIEIYLFAGLHKLNYGFAVMLAGMLQPLVVGRWQADPSWLGAKVLVPAAVAAALWECGWGVLLSFARTRRMAAACLIAMHVVLLLLLGPLGLDLNRSVWPWNVVNVVLLWRLFWRREPWDLATAWDSHPYARGAGAAVLVVGLLALAGVADGYLGFSLYSGNTTEGALYVDPKRIAELPEPVRKLAKTDGVLDINRWSIEELGTPVCPATRIYTAVGRQVGVWLRHGDAVRVIEFSRPALLTGRRTSRSYDPLTQ